MLQNIKEKSTQLVNLIFKFTNKSIAVQAPLNTTLLEVAHSNKIELEGACEGSLACSTCHVVLDNDLYNKLGEPSDREYDMLDQAFGVTPTSRLGCQVKVCNMMENRVIKVPEETRNMAVDGFKPKPH